MTLGVLTVLFWNLGGNAPLESIGRIVDSWSVDVAAFAETPFRDDVLGRKLTRCGLARFASLCERLVICVRPEVALSEARSAERHSVVAVERPAGPEMLLAFAHLRSRLHSSAYDRATWCRQLADHIREAEAAWQTDRTALLGDLNLDPFEDVVVAADGLHGVMTRERAGKQARTVDGREWPFFDNPMWSRMGDASPGPAGTYHYARGSYECRFWHTFDQVLLRPTLLQAFADDDLAVLTDDGVQSLVTPRGYPRKGSVSDHLPLVLRIRP